MATTWYHTVNGDIIGETTSVSRTSYLTDGLGSVTATQNAAGATTATWRYKPYGTLLAKTGVGQDPSFLWIGSYGYRILTGGDRPLYIRARHLKAGHWVSKDRYWPQEMPYNYAWSNPTTHYDPTGDFCQLYFGRTIVWRMWCLDSGNLQILPGMGSPPPIRDNVPHPNPCKECGLPPPPCCGVVGRRHQYVKYEFRQEVMGGKLAPMHGFKEIADLSDSCPKDPKFNPWAILRAGIEAIPWVGGPINNIIDGIEPAQEGGLRRTKPWGPPKALKCKGKGWMLVVDVSQDYRCYAQLPCGPSPGCDVGPPLPHAQGAGTVHHTTGGIRIE